MAVMMGREGRINQASQYVPYNRSGIRQQKTPGRAVGVIAVKGNDQHRDFNPLVLFFTVSKYRKDLNTVVEQIERQKKAQLPDYEKSLFSSCFKNW